MDDIFYEMSGEMQDEKYENIYKHLSHEKVFFTLHDYKKQGDGGSAVSGVCPECGMAGAHFFAYKKLRYGVCSNPDCNKRVHWKDYVRKQYNLKTEKDVLYKLRELAGISAEQAAKGGV